MFSSYIFIRERKYNTQFHIITFLLIDNKSIHEV